ncbi:MAG TPA: type IVB secretion system protein IcmH/DotU [Thermohalobaculum sp.]|nr:type IVB secretion system protein IcmH/DotU [Thermohalobaculum sp.]
MSRDNPFGLSEDRAKTRFRTRGSAEGRQPPPRSGQPVRRRPRPHPNPMIAAFAELLEFAPELESAHPPSDPDQLRTRLLQSLSEARDAAVAKGVPLVRADAGAWAVAALLDDLVLNTPWGRQSIWPSRPLVATLYRDVDAGDRFFKRLDELENAPNRDPDLLELMYVCLALGFQGRYRVPGRAGSRSLAAVRASASRFLRDSDAEDAPLSPRWRGVDAKDEKPRFVVPLWVVGLVAVAVSAAIFVLLELRLGDQAGVLLARARDLPPLERAEVIRPVREEVETVSEPFVFALLPEFEAAAPEGLRRALRGGENASVVRLAVQGSSPELFQSGEADINEVYAPLIESMARVMVEHSDLTGAITVVGHTDSVPIQGSNLFSSNQELSEERARTIAELLARSGVEPERLAHEGRAALEPIADNGTREGRAANRRIEILVQKRV